MNQFVPKLFDCMKGYSKEQFVKDVIAGIIVAIIALPLSIALALASGVGPEQGIYTAIFAGFVISFLGGSRVQIAGPTAAFATIVAGIVAEHQMEGLVVAIEVGIVLAALLFLKRMSDVTAVKSWKYLGSEIDENNDPDKISLKVVPKHTLVYEIIGPMFFAAADKFLEISAEPGIKVVIIRMRGVPAMDVTALRSLTNIHEICKKKGITLVLSHVQEQPRAMMEKAGFAGLVGEENFCANIDAALAHAAEIDR